MAYINVYGPRSDGVGDLVARIHVGTFALEAAESLTDAEHRFGATFGRPMTDEERSELEAARAESERLAAEHGPDYHGFGHPA